MLRKIKYVIFFYVCMCVSSAFALGTVTIMTDSSMNIAMSQLARDYSSRHNVVVNTSYASKQAQQSQISEGGAADILVTPESGWIEELKTQGLVDVYSQIAVAKNRLALVAPVTSPLSNFDGDNFPTTQLIMQFSWEPSFVVANPETLIEGGYTREALRNLGASNDLEEYTLYIKQLAQMYSMVKNQGMYGIFFYSSTIGRSGIRVLGLLPENSHKPIEYSAAAIAGDNMDEARKFLKYVQSKEAKRILENNGFTVK